MQLVTALFKTRNRKTEAADVYGASLQLALILSLEPCDRSNAKPHSFTPMSQASVD